MLITFLDRRNSENFWTDWQKHALIGLNWQTRYLLSKRNFLGKITELVSDVDVIVWIA